MRCLAATIFLLVTTVTANAVYYRPVAPPPIVKIFTGGGSGGAGGAVFGGFGVFTGVVFWCGANEPRRGARDTWHDPRHDTNYNGGRITRDDGCLIRRKPAPVSVRG